MKRIVYLLFLVMCISSCKNQKVDDVYTAFPESHTLTAEIHQIPPIMLNPRGMYLLDSSLVVFNDGLDTCFQVFDRNSLEYRYSFGLKGNGPEDFNMPSGDVVYNRQGEVAILDVNMLKVISFKDGHPVVGTRKIPAQNSYYNGLISLNDSLFVCNGDFEDTKEFMFIHGDGTLELKVDYPEGIDRFGSILQRNQAYEHMAVARPSGDRFASFYTFQRAFRIINEKGDILKNVTLAIEPFDEQIPVDDEQRRIHVLSVRATQDYIYTLNLDMTPEEIYQQKSFPSIQVYSWDGEPVKKYNLDRFISSFTIDESSQMIYGAFAEKEDEIYVFRMK
ncbi:MAG: TolB-like 6-bladed beta-propeller domain-containing protein [Candidatus Paraprevotella stercoravium]|uniref:TolB-like 6-bladed beta-propeller domain-containing protein n=1 Tax=Candidatus Paraprevotella stercoravium TaxID=2838725 RepID=A0A9E2L5Z9_9BACT|nr:TolB-like 6-bladed beta-propeller domain-containing protein [Candidatus Paraprevotella stercoravium]